MSSRQTQKRWQSVDKASIPIATLADRYLSACRSAGMSPKTIRGYDEKLKRYIRMSGGTLGDFTLQAVRNHLTELQQARKWAGNPYTRSSNQLVSATTVRNHGRVLTGFASWLYGEGYAEGNLLSALKLPRANDVRMEPLTDEEIQRLLSRFDTDLELGCRNAAMIWLFLDTGLRCAELVGMQMENLFLDTRRLKILGKGRKERVVPFGHQTKRLMERYICQLRPQPVLGDMVFLASDGYPITENTVKMVIKRASRTANIPRLHVHLLRHTFATRFVLRGGDTMWLQTVMGHERLETTQRYVKRGALQQVVLQKAPSPMDELVLARRPGTRRQSIAEERRARPPGSIA